MQPAIAEKRIDGAGRNCLPENRDMPCPKQGDNAIYKVLDDIAWFRDYRFQRSSLLGPMNERNHGKRRYTA